MLCPFCNDSLYPITLKSNLGKSVLDYCSECGGVWSDKGEINFISKEELSPLINLLPKEVNHDGNRQLLCPRERRFLENYLGNNIPLDLDLFKCPACFGFWFPYGSLPRFKEAQEVKLNYFKIWKLPLTSIYAILLPLLILSLVGGGILATLIGVRQQTEVRIQATDLISPPLTLSLAEGEIIISFTSTRPEISQIKYWTIGEAAHEEWVSTVPQKTHTIHLKNLTPNQTFSYQIILTEPDMFITPIYLFTTK